MLKTEKIPTFTVWHRKTNLFKYIKYINNQIKLFIWLRS